MRISRAHGMAPIKGPKKGMTLVTPMMTAKRAGYGKLKRLQHTSAMIPMMRESSSLPLIKPLMMR